MNKTKYYAVKKGRNPGIYKTWSEAEKEVINYNGAIYKSFNSIDDAKEYLYDKKNEIKKEYQAIAYTDGSYSIYDKSFSYGLVILFNNNEYWFSKRFNNIEFQKSRNVSGELMGALKAMSFCYDNNIKSLLICHDYNGVRYFATKEWKANINLTKKYNLKYNKYREKVDIDFKWVKGHSNDFYNDLADKLANEADFTLKTKILKKE